MQDEQWLETKQMNKVVVKISMTFYSKAWQHQNEVLHDNRKYREYVIEWHRQLNDKIEKGHKLNMKKYVRMQKLDIKKCDTGYIELWNISTTNMMKNAVEEKVNNIRNYFPVR